MTDKQTNKKNMAATTKQLLDTNLTLWETITAFFSQHALLANSLTTINALGIIQNTDNTGYGEEKQNFKEIMADKTMVVAGPLSANARINNDKPLLRKVDIVRTDITKAKDEDAPNIAKLILEKANDLDPATLIEIGLVPANITALNESIVAFVAATPKPREAQTITETATENLEEEFETLDKILVTLDELMEPFKENENDFYKEYKVARKIVDTGVRHISIRGKVRDADDEAKVPRGFITATAPGVEAVKVKISKLALYRVYSREAGSYTLTIESPDYVTQVITNVVVEPDEITDIDIQLVKE